MAFDIMMIKQEGGILIPATCVDVPAFNRLPKGREVGVTIKELRNGRFHRKFFALIKLMYEHFPEVASKNPEHVGIRSMEGFRNDALIKLGYFSYDVRANGSIRFVPDSISYANCSQAKIEGIFEDLLELGVRTMAGYADKDHLRDVVEELLEFQA